MDVLFQNYNESEQFDKLSGKCRKHLSPKIFCHIVFFFVVEWIIVDAFIERSKMGSYLTT